MEPISTSAALAAAAGGLQGLGQVGSALSGDKASKRKAREDKRRTLAQMLNEALNRESQMGEGSRKRGADLATQRAQALQNIASQYVQAFK